MVTQLFFLSFFQNKPLMLETPSQILHKHPHSENFTESANKSAYVEHLPCRSLSRLLLRNDNMLERGHYCINFAARATFWAAVMDD